MDITKFEEAEHFFSTFFLGKHHIPRSGIKPYGSGWCVNCFDNLSTFDDDKLTRLVFLAHDMCFRASIRTGGPPNRIKIAIWKRGGRIGRMYERHPTISEALRMWTKIKNGIKN